jgi:hypothetical protein
MATLAKTAAARPLETVAQRWRLLSWAVAASVAMPWLLLPQVVPAAMRPTHLVELAVKVEILAVSAVPAERLLRRLLPLALSIRWKRF